MAFTLIGQQFIVELSATASFYRHEATGAQVLSVAAPDENKVFGITFRTPPSRSNGVAHILEHSVLCGSRKYPVKEPFVELMKGSLNTFLNAMTYPDRTCYPVASTNLKDFYNLIDVYLDAVFYPILSEHTFRQEGWHFEPDPDSGMFRYKGVVFNEMKGAYSDPDDLHDDLCRRSLFPDTPYSFDAGGDPLEIPSLTYDEFLEFHRRFYHPSNAFIFFYGDDDPARRLSFLESWLEPFGLQPVDALPPRQPPFQEPRRHRFGYDTTGIDEPKAYAAVNWVLPVEREPFTSMQIAVLFHALAGTPASPLRKALIESGLGEDLAGFGMMEELRQTAFSVGLKGVDPAKVDEVEQLVLNTLERIASEGFDRDTIAASLNTIEFALRERNTGRYPRGLDIMLDVLNTWLYGGDPLKALAFQEPLEAVKREAEADPWLFPSLIKRLLLQSPHRTFVALVPDPAEGVRRAKAEEDMLAKAVSGMDEKARTEAIHLAAELKRLQETPDSPEALATIPVLSIEDLPRKAPEVPSEAFELAGAGGVYHELPTGSIAYVDLCFPFDHVPARLLPLMGIFGRILLETGTASKDFVQLIQSIGIHTGGIRSSLITTSKWNQPNDPIAWFFLRGKALPDKVAVLADLLAEILTSARFDNRERIRQIILEEKAQAESSLMPAASRMVALRLRSGFTPADWANEHLYGIEHLFFLRALADRAEHAWETVEEDLVALKHLVLHRNRILMHLTADRPVFEASLEHLAKVVHVLPQEADSPEQSWVAAARHACSGVLALPKTETLEAPAQVNAVGMAVSLAGTGMPDGSALVAGKYLDTVYLWEKVRVIGGAYGGYSSIDLATGMMLCVSYRDPNLTRTINVFRHVAEFLQKADPPREEIVKSIIGTIGDIDAYQLPDAKGFTALINMLTGFTQEHKQRVRESVLDADLHVFRKLGKTLAAALPDARFCALVAPERAAQSAQELPQPISRVSLY